MTALDDPFTLFHQWFKAADRAEPSLPDAMSVATCTPDGRPSVRMVLLKGAGPDGFVFYTNADSRKGLELGRNPWAALCLYWKSLGRQVRAEGPVSAVSGEEADAYFASRPRGSQLGAWASDQSRVLPARQDLIARLAEVEKKFQGRSVGRPPHWTGYRIRPDTIEFWHDVPNRLHDRLVYTRSDAGWRNHRLYP
ncbi:MAG: pyridoxamine 5'-phosphate oxidase [Rhodospirillaceae bacterium]|nr:pyridoxamine 5'-phosphate oxidase [Rhodospirillaceae bacterium]